MGILAVDSIKSRTVAPVTVSDDLNVTGVSTVGVSTATSVVGCTMTVNAFRQMHTTTTMVEVSALYVSMRNHHSKQQRKETK